MTKSSAGAIPEGLTLFVFYDENGLTYSHFYSYAAQAIEEAEISGWLSCINIMTGECVYAKPTE